MHLLALPHELIFQIADSVQMDTDLSSLAQTCYFLYEIANPLLYGRSTAPLFWAADRGAHDTLRRCLAYGADVHVRTQEGLTLAAVAAMHNHDSVVDILLAQPGADPNETILNGRTMLSLAAEKNSTAVVKLLLAREDIAVDLPDNLGATPLWYAAWTGRPSTVRLLLATKRANPNTVAMPPRFSTSDDNFDDEFYDDFTDPMSVAYAAFQKLELKFDEDLWGYPVFLPNEGSKREREEAIALLLKVPELRFPQWQALLWHTATHGPAEIAGLLLGRPGLGAREFLSKDANETARLLHRASTSGQDGVVEVLVDLGVDVDVDVDYRDERGGRTPLSVAAGYTSQPRLLRRLIESGAEVESEDDDGCTPLYHAIWSGRLCNIEELTLHGAELARIRRDGIAALVRHAAEQGHVTTLQYLLRGGVDLDITYHAGGRTPLMYAAMRGRVDAVAWLAQQEGVDVNLRDKDEGWTAMHISVDNGAFEAVRMLLADQRTNINVKDDSGLTPVGFSAARLMRMYAEWDGPFGHWVPRDNRHSVPAEIIVEDLLSRQDAVIELGDAGSLALDALFVPAAQKGSTRILKLLLGQWREHIHITEERVKEAARVGPRDSMLLLVQEAQIKITDPILEAAVRNHGNGNGTAILKMLLEYYQGELTPRLAVIAASSGELSTMDLFLGLNDRAIRVTPELLVAAASNETCGKEMLSLLLAQSGEIQFTEELVHAGIQNSNDPIGMTQILLDTLHDDFPITDTVVALAWDASPISRNKIMPMLLDRFRNNEDSIHRIIDITLRTVSDADSADVFLQQLRAVDIPVPDAGVVIIIRRFGMELVGKIFRQRGSIRVSDEIVEASAKHEDGRDVVHFLLAKAETVDVSDAVFAAIEGQKSGQAIIRLLQDRGLIGHLGY
ncbi:ankyrin repeat-containing domain protein [Aspergillus heterothallicus]